MARDTADQTVQRLLAVSRSVLANEGRDRLTLDRVVGEARLSKGALLYHFRNKLELTRRIMTDAIAAFDERVAQLRGEDRSPGAYTRAYIEAATREIDTPEAAQSSQVMSELAREPELRELYHQAVARWTAQIEGDGLDPVLAQVLRLATDGLYWSESVGAPPLDANVRAACLRWMLEAAGGAGRVSAPASTGHPQGGAP